MPVVGECGQNNSVKPENSAFTEYKSNNIPDLRNTKLIGTKLVL
jgi:hypothetical protein